jgi:hypothetical protein
MMCGYPGCVSHFATIVTANDMSGLLHEKHIRDPLDVVMSMVYNFCSLFEKNLCFIFYEGCKVNMDDGIVGGVVFSLLLRLGIIVHNRSGVFLFIHCYAVILVLMKPC